jgi:hypothetical protein
MSWIAAHRRAELWKKRYLELEGRIQQSKSTTQSRRLLWRTPKSTSQLCMTLYDADRPFLLSGAVRFLTATLPFEPDIAVDIFGVVHRIQTTKAVGQKILHTLSVLQFAFDDAWTAPSPLVFSKYLGDPRWNFSKLLLGNREPILTPSWQSVTPIKRPWMRSRQRAQKAWLQQKFGDAQAGRGASFWRLQLRSQTSHARNHASRGRWTGRKTVEFRTRRGNDRSLFQRKNRQSRTCQIEKFYSF